MAPKMKRGPWLAEEDAKLSQFVKARGAKRWKTVATESGLNRSGKSCRLRWLNYLSPNIKRGNISEAEEDLIIRLHKLLGNRWSLIAGRLPGRTDNEIKNHWNSHLSKKINHKGKTLETSSTDGGETETTTQRKMVQVMQEDVPASGKTENLSPSIDDLFDFSTEGTYGLDWVNKFLEFDYDPLITSSESVSLSKNELGL